MLDLLLASGSFDPSSITIDGDVTKLVAIGGSLLVACVIVVAGMLRSVAIGRAREASRREIAAYVAEGSMSAEEGERLLDAGRPHWERWRCS